MRYRLIGLLLVAAAAMPAGAQRTDNVDRRVDRLEQEMRAVQRRVFPDGRAQFVEPELRPEQRAEGAIVSGDALSSLGARVDAVETQLRALTGQVEEQGHRTSQLEAQIVQLRAELQARRPAETPAREEPAPVSTEREAETPAPASAASGDGAEAAYNEGYRLWNSGRHGEAQQRLEAAATQYPTGRWISWIRNLQGRAYLDDDKPATAARILLANYQENPRGERAADSLYFLGQSLARLNRRTEACRVYAELEQVYPNMRDFLRQRLPQARTDARCGAAAAR